MSAQAAGKQVIRWTLGSARCSVLNQIVLGGYHVRRDLSMTCGLRCSQPSKASMVSHPRKELCPLSLLDMGLTHTQAERICEVVTSSPGGHAGQDAPSTLLALFVLGLSPSSVVKVVEKCPELCYVKSTQLEQRIGNLRKRGLLEGSLQRVVSHYPQILTLPPKRINSVVRFLREKCLFTSQQLTDILRDSPSVVQEDLGLLEYKFQYAYFRMGIKQAEMLKAKVFRVSLEELRCRHAFLERRGLFQTPDKKGQTLILNPNVQDVLSVTEDAYLSQVAMATQEEFDVFRKLMAREWQEEEWQEVGSDDDEEEEEEEEEEEGGKAGYQNRRKR